MVNIGFFDRVENNYINMIEMVFQTRIEILINSNEFTDELFDVLCKLEPGQLIKVEYEQINGKNELRKLFFLKQCFNNK